VSLPFTRGELEAALAPLGEARMLPATAYVDDDVLAWEREHVFAAGWQVVAHASSLAMPDAQLAASAGTGSVLVVRDGDVLRGFANVCRHRGHELVGVGEGTCRPGIRCPYHGWTYDLDGRLRVATGGLAGADPDALALVTVPVAEHLGWVFVNVAGGAPPPTEAFAGLDEVLGPHDAGALVPLEARTYEVGANWKVIHENYQECVHCPCIHPELCRVSPPASGDNLAPGPAWVGGWMDLAEGAATMSMGGAAVAPARPGLDERARRRVAYVALLPTLLVSAHPDYVLTHRLEPLAPDRTRVSCEWLAASGVTSGALADAVELWDVTNRQDWAACESVQRGLGSGAWVPGPLAPREDAVHAVVRWFARQYLEGERGRRRQERGR